MRELREETQPSRSIETRNKVHACMAHRWNKTKKKTVLRIRLGRDQRRSRCLVALSKRWKLALIRDRSHRLHHSRFVGHGRAQFGGSGRVDKD